MAGRDTPYMAVKEKTLYMAGHTTAAVSDRFGKSAVKGGAKVKGEESGMCG